jgi:hypothetical protein
MIRGIVAVFLLLIAYGSAGREVAIEADSLIPDADIPS